MKKSSIVIVVFYILLMTVLYNVMSAIKETSGADSLVFYLAVLFFVAVFFLIATHNGLDKWIKSFDDD